MNAGEQSSTGGNRLFGREAFLRLLESEGIGHLFGNPGTTELPIMAALPDCPSIRYILALQESLVVAMADGYSRVSGELSACNVHVAPGLGNAMGSLYNAKWIGSPIIVTAGQQEQGHGLTEPLLYDPLVPIAAPLVKWAVEVTRFEDLPRIMRRAAKIALAPPTGPVFISLPGDILNEQGGIDLGRPTRVDALSRPSDEALDRLAERLLRAERPLVIAGHEIALGDAFAETVAVVELLGAPVYQQTIVHGAHFPSAHPAFMGALRRDQRMVREILKEYDLIFCIGSDVLRMSVHSEVEPMPEGIALVQLGQRDWEMGKNYPAEIALRADVKESLRALAPRLEKRLGGGGKADARSKIARLASSNWSAQRSIVIERATSQRERKPIPAELMVLRVIEALPEDAALVDEGLVSTYSLPALYPFRDPRCYFGLASGGIGFAMAGAVGIKLASKARPVVAIIGDGSAMYSIQALWTAANAGLAITYIIANNGGYRIIKERLRAFHGVEDYTGMEFKNPAIDFTALARAMGVFALRIEDAEEIGPAIRASLERSAPTLIEVMVDDGFSNEGR
eukprot:XP_011406627.1 PREDICTED: uncharacterized protein LOC105314254 [Amphimedon queenslandica]